MSNAREQELLRQFGKWVATIRKDSKLTQQQLAEKTDLSVVAVAYIENGKRWPRLYTLDKLSKALGVSIDEMLYGLRKK